MGHNNGSCNRVVSRNDLTRRNMAERMSDRLFGKVVSGGVEVRRSGSAWDASSFIPYLQTRD